MTVDASEAWQKWHERRIETVSAPYGPLSLVGTHGVEGFPDGRLPAIPGRWTSDGDGVVLTAVAPDGLTVDGEPFAGEVRLTADQGPAGAARVGLGERRLVVLVREGSWGVGRLRRLGQRRRQLPLLVSVPAAPDAEGRTTVDFNRALLPPCAFVDQFVCSFPPPGNTLVVAVAAGERNVRQNFVRTA